MGTNKNILPNKNFELILLKMLPSQTVRKIKIILKVYFNLLHNAGFCGVMVSTLDSESSDPSSNLGKTYSFSFF